ncbi:DHHW family protein [Paenibacillus rigui]|uniref:AlgX/AlgJ SGNH hydrolase-like domain-containing protein n=1 Tax=Paenibacillus rigui TaxID=554312 RepID=A0A229UG99_9BACL|nr:DHHW family protein [Paenibacillus rigui]OXM82416.1 hypothetical protein CF651_31145 [Paenibacillus rigui]
MKRHIFKKMIAAVLFIVFLFAFSIQNVRLSYQPLKEAWQSSDFHFASLKETISKLDHTMNETVYEKFKFIEAYGFVQAVMDKNEESNFEVVKDTEGQLHYTYFTNKPNPTSELTERVSNLRSQITNQHVKLSYMLTPDKYIRGYTQFPLGIPYNYSNETADQFLSELKQIGVDTIDLREGLRESGIPTQDLFFKTDHHWKIETAFWGFGQLVKHLNQIDGNKLDPTGFYTNIDNYNKIEYKNAYIGSMGRKTGKYYTGADDFTLIYPKFKTDYEFMFKSNQLGGTLNGRFEEALLTTYPLRMDGNDYGLTGDKYFTYLYGNQAFVHIQNKDKKDGPKMLFIKDSLAVPLISFLSTVCSDIYLLDPRYYKEDMAAFINQTELDHVIISFSPQNLVTEFFPFGVKP